jgi:hypothetical protein
MDGRYINSVHRKFGGKTLKTVPNFTLWDLFDYTFIKRIEVIPLLNYIDYKHEEVDHILKTELAWEYYGGHHHESYYTNFFQSFLLPQKFNIDKRMLEYSALVRSGQMERETALKEFLSVPYTFSEELVDYTLRKLGLSEEEFKHILNQPPKSFKDYPSYYPIVKIMQLPIKAAADLGLIPTLLYQKYFA